MNNPNFTAKWIVEEVEKLLDSGPENDHATIGLLLNLLENFDRALGTLYKASTYASSKAGRAKYFLYQALGAEESGRSRSENLQLAYEELTVLARQNFVLME